MIRLSKSFLVFITLLSSILNPCRDLFPDKNDGISQVKDPIIFQKEEDNGTYTVSFVFAQAGARNGIGVLPKEVMALLPKERSGYRSGDIVSAPESFSDVGTWHFLGWEPAEMKITDSDGIFSGIWTDLSEQTFIIAETNDPKAEAGVLYSGFGSLAWGVHNKGGYTGTYNFLLGGMQAYCIQSDKTVPAAGSVYRYQGTDDSKIARIISKGTMNGMSPGAIQAALWNYATQDKTYAWVDSQESTDYDDAVYSSGGWACHIDIYVPDNPAYQRYAIERGCEPPAPQAKVKVLKKAAKTDFDYVRNCPNNYSLKGAKYAIYSDQNCTKKVGEFTTAADGSTEAIELEPGTYYIKETKASPGFQLDRTIYTVKAKADQTVTVTSTEIPVNDPVYLTLKKQNARDPDDIHGFEEAEFTVSYYDAQTDDLKNKKPKYRWIFRPILTQDGKAEVILDEEHYLRGDPLLLDQNGNFFLPLGTFAIQESKAPAGFAKDESVYIGHVRYVNGNVKTEIAGGDQLIVDHLDLTQLEKPQSVRLIIRKTDSETGKQEAQGFATFEGAEFSVFRQDEESNEKQYVGTIVTDREGKGSIDKDLDGLDLLPGIYYLKESKAPDGYLADDREYEIEALANEPDKALFEYEIEIKEQISEVIIRKIDSLGNDFAGAQLELLDEDGNIILAWTSDGTEKVIKGLAIGKRYILHETASDRYHAIAEDIALMPDRSGKTQITMVDGIIAIRTEASFADHHKKEHVADGVATISDHVRYEWLDPSRKYLLKGKLIDKGTADVPEETVILEQEMEFVPEDKNGTVIMNYEIDLDGYDNHDFVIHEELYLPEEGTENEALAVHADSSDPLQTVHVKELYRAAVVLHKTNPTKSIRLNGAIFYITAVRRKADGRKEETDLGNQVTGGIYMEQDETFQVLVAKDPEMKEVIGIYDSSLQATLKKQAVMILDLEEGEYYAQIKGNDDIRRCYVIKGSIFLPKLPEDTEVTFTELVPPIGYRLRKDPFTVSVGHEYSIDVIENYRANEALILPKTGIE